MGGVADTSRDALTEISKTGRAAIVTDAIFRAVERAPCGVGAGTSMREIKAELADVDGLDVDLSTISGRVVELVRAKRIRRKAVKRLCTVTGQLIGPLEVVPLQDRVGR